MQYLCMVPDGNFTYCGDHIEIYRNIKSICYATGTNIELQVNYTSKTNKETQKKKKRLGLWLPEVGFEGQWDWMTV